MARRRRNPEAIALLEDLLDEAMRGELQEVFVLVKDQDGFWSDDDVCGDPQELIYELNTVALRRRCDLRREPTQQ